MKKRFVDHVCRFAATQHRSGRSAAESLVLQKLKVGFRFFFSETKLVKCYKTTSGEIRKFPKKILTLFFGGDENFRLFGDENSSIFWGGNSIPAWEGLGVRAHSGGSWTSTERTASPVPPASWI